MAVHIIRVDKLSPEALQGVVEEFVSRNGTDYGAVEASHEAKCRAVKRTLENGSAILIYDEETETTNIFRADDPVLKKIGMEF